MKLGIASVSARCGLVIAALWLASSCSAAPNTFVSRFLQRDAQVVTVTDVSDAGRLLRVPSRSNPVYYELLVLGYEDFGRSIAGVKLPDKTAMLKLMMKLLADRGYFPANKKHDPEMLLAVAWGTMNGKLGMALPFMGGDKLDLLWELDAFPPSATRLMTRFMRSPTADLVMEAASGNLYVISVQAFDEAEALQGRTKLLWHTKVSCPSNGLDMIPTLRQMARESAAYLGRETGKPVWTTTTEKEARVDLGELKILEAIDPAKLPVTEWTEEQNGRSRRPNVRLSP